MKKLGCSRGLVSLVLAATLLGSGCKSTPPQQQQMAIRNPDGSITNPDGSVTYPAGSPQAQQAESVQGPANGATRNPDGSVTYPAGTQRAQREANEGPRQPAREGAANAGPGPAAARRGMTLSSGTPVVVRVTQTLSASQNNAGDTFTGVLDQAIATGDGSVVFPRGTPVAGSVVAAKGRGRFKGAGDLGIEVTAIGNQRVTTSEYEKAQAGKGKRTAGIIGGGAGLGAIIGGLAGGGKGALIGGLAGAGAGTAGAAYTGNKDVVIPSESVITFQLTAPLTLR